MKIIDKLLLLKGAKVGKLLHDVDRSDYRQKVLKVDKISMKKHYQLSHQALARKIHFWEPIRYPITNKSH